ncbi:hypothetical protein RLIN73S_00225 [Rhodanobacter lindaniclasticus]
MRTGSRRACFTASAFLITSRSLRAWRAASSCGASRSLPRSQPATRSTAWPVQSIRRNHDSPVASVTAIRNSASSSNGAPVEPNADSTACPTHTPMMPPTPCGCTGSCAKFRYSSAGPVMKKNTKPTRRNAGSHGCRGCWPRWRNTCTPSSNSSNGKQYATRPKIQRSRSAM